MSPKQTTAAKEGVESKPKVPPLDRIESFKELATKDPELERKNKELYSFLRDNFVGKMYSRGLRQNSERNVIINELWASYQNGEKDGTQATKFSATEIDRAFEDAKALVALSKMVDEGNSSFPPGAFLVPLNDPSLLTTPEEKRKFWLDAKSLIFEQKNNGTYKVFWSDDNFTQRIQRPVDMRLPRYGEDVSDNYADYYSLLGAGTNAVSNGVPLFKQGDPRYRTVKYGSGTMASSACGPTSMAMVMNSMGLPLSPVELARWSERNGHRINGVGTSWEFFRDCAKSFGKECIELEKDMNDIVDCLQQGRPVIASVHRGSAEGGSKIFTRKGHFIVITGYNPANNTFSINDPGGRDVSWCTVKELQSAINNSWVVYNGNSSK